MHKQTQPTPSGFSHPDLGWLMLRIQSFLRQRGLGYHDAQDLSQEAMLRLWKNRRAHVAEWPHFQRLAMVAAKHVHLSLRRTMMATKRGGGKHALQLAQELTMELDQDGGVASPDVAVVHTEELAIASTAIGKVRDDYVAQGKAALVALLESVDGAARDGQQVKRAQRLGIRPGALRTALHRYRRRCQLVLLREIRGDVAA